MWKIPFLNPDPLTHWSGPKNVALVRIDGGTSWALLENGSTINAVMPEFIKTQSLDVGPLSNLVDSMMGINGFGGLFSQPLGYIIVRVQVEGVRGYDKDQVALVIPDSTNFWSWVPVTLGTLTIKWIINVIKESETDKLLASVNGLGVSCLLACHWAELSIRSEMSANQTMGSTDWNEAVKMIKKEEIEAFSSKIIHTQTKTIFLGSNMHWWCRSWNGVMDPICPMAWVSWISIPKWLPRASKLQSWWKPDCHSDHHCQGHQSHSSSSCKCTAPGGGCTGNIGEARWDSRYPAN